MAKKAKKTKRRKLPKTKKSKFLPKKKNSKKSKKIKPKIKSTKRLSSEIDAKKVELIAKGKNRGFITYDEILKEFPTIENNLTLLVEVRTSLYLTLFKREISAYSKLLINLTIPKAINSPPTPPGGSGKPLLGPWQTKAAP